MYAYTFTIPIVAFDSVFFTASFNFFVASLALFVVIWFFKFVASFIVGG